jgi:tetratricopeptide (TPR) repeat protein
LAHNYLKQKPEDYIMLNNIGSALNIIGMYKTAAIYLRKAVEINSDFELAANNLKLSERGEESESVNDLINFSLIAYNLENYDECVRYSQLALEINPKNIESLNNICAAKIALGEYSEAIKYCNKALSINPEYEIARNNLENAKKELKKLNK